MIEFCLVFLILELTIAIILVLKELRKIDSKVERLKRFLVNNPFLPANNNENAWDSDSLNLL